MLYTIQQLQTEYWSYFNTLNPGRFVSNFKSFIFKPILNNSLGTHCDIALRLMPQNLTNEKSTLVPIMSWCHQALVLINLGVHSWLRFVMKLISRGILVLLLAFKTLTFSKVILIAYYNILNWIMHLYSQIQSLVHHGTPKWCLFQELLCMYITFNHCSIQACIRFFMIFCYHAICLPILIHVVLIWQSIMYRVILLLTWWQPVIYLLW